MSDDRYAANESESAERISRRSLLQASTVVLTGTVITKTLGLVETRSLGAESSNSQPKPETAVVAVDVEQREIFRSARKPAYTSWGSLFPGHNGE